MDTHDIREWMPANLPEALAAEVQAERTARELTLEQFAQLAGMKAQSVGRYLRREREMSATVISAFADALGMKVSELTGKAEDRLEKARQRRPETPDELMKRHLSGPPE